MTSEHTTSPSDQLSSKIENSSKITVQENPGKLNELGRKAYDSKEYYEAIKYYNKAIELDPNLGISYSNRADAKRDLRDLRGALSDYNIAIEHGINSFNNRAIAKSGLKDYEGAIADFEKSISIDSRTASTYLNLAITYFTIEKYENAINDCKNALSVNPNYGEAYYWMGVAKTNIGQKNDGCLDLSKAGELGFREAYDVIKQVCN